MIVAIELHIRAYTAMTSLEKLERAIR